MKKSMRVLTSPITILMIALVATIFVGSIPAYAGSAASSAITQYEKGMISEAELEQRLQSLGYSNDDIRQVKALSGGFKAQQQTPTSQPIIQEETSIEPKLEKTKVSSSSADDIMLVMGIAGGATAAAIIVAIAKRPV